MDREFILVDGHLIGRQASQKASDLPRPAGPQRSLTSVLRDRVGIAGSYPEGAAEPAATAWLGHLTTGSKSGDRLVTSQNSSCNRHSLLVRLDLRSRTQGFPGGSRTAASAAGVQPQHWRSRRRDSC